MAILREGPYAYRALGIANACGTKLYSLSCDVLDPRLYERPMGTSRRELIFTYGGGMLGGKTIKSVFTGGQSNTLLTAADLDVSLDFVSVRSRALAPWNHRDNRHQRWARVSCREVTRYVEFFAAESCGQCLSCKCGTFQMARLLHRIGKSAQRRASQESMRSATEFRPLCPHRLRGNRRGEFYTRVPARIRYVTYCYRVKHWLPSTAMTITTTNWK